MRSFIFIALASTTFIACDGAVDTATETDVKPFAALVASEPAELAEGADVAECHAAYNRAADRIEDAIDDAASCRDSNDCTVTVTETRCTGEIVAAVSVLGEIGFLDYVARVDLNVCNDTPKSCAAAYDPDPKDVTVACIAHRCELVDNIQKP